VPAALSAAKQRDVDLAQAAGKGTTALRDASGNVLQMNADAPYPLLRPMGVDASVAFTQGGVVKMISPDTLQDRDLTARDIASSGRVDGEFVGANNMGANVLGVGDVRAAQVNVGRVHIDDNGVATPGLAAGGTVGAGRFVCGPVNIDPNGIATPGLGVGGLASVGRLTCGPVNIDPNGIATPGLAAGGTVGGALGSFNDLRYGRLVPWSAERLKHDREPLQRTEALAAIGAVAWDRWRYRQGSGVTEEQAEQEHIGPMADELAQHPLLSSLVVRDADDQIEGYELTSLVGVLGKAVADLATEVADLRRRLEEKPAARYPWEPGWSPFNLT
jgi:hypothetical protein